MYIINMSFCMASWKKNLCVCVCMSNYIYRCTDPYKWTFKCFGQWNMFLNPSWWIHVTNSYVLGLHCLKCILFSWRSLLCHKKAVPPALKYLDSFNLRGDVIHNHIVFSGMKFSITVWWCVNKASSFIFH